MVTVFGILNLTEDSFFDESRRLDPAGAVTAAIEMLRVGSDVVDVGPAASHPDARPVSPADEIRRIAPLLDALSDQMHRVSIDSFQPETQRYALKRGVGYLNDIQGFPDPALYPILLRRTAGWWLCTQRSGMASPPAPVTFDPKTRSTRLCGSSRRGFPPCDGAGSLPTGSSSIRGWDFLEPRTGNIAARAVEPSKAEVGVGASAIGLGVAEILLGATVGLPVKDLGPASLAAELHAIGNGADYVRTHAPGDLRSAITIRKPSRNFAVATPETEG
ncbi:Dihydropteroate synthase 1 [Citrobacter werkmanii]|uniref:Dihydropteroate synthase 1 n=1 Tax=Citrobacter werkmanii TaxID=67827 RepID=A0ABM8N597_9ENTR|nr:Dihydropteroate synthase 1 [Citrobacter werkmanii]